MTTCPLDGAALIQFIGARDVAPSEELAAGTMVGEYRIERRIGIGGMGVVYGAHHPVLGKRAAIKVLSVKLSADREGVARFIQEGQAVNRIGHANIVDIFAFGTLPDGRAYFAMEWLQGQTLQQRLDREVVSIADAVAILLALARALDAAHAAGVVHRDLKPDNVFLVDDDETFRVKLLDFGIAKLQADPDPASTTGEGTTIGTPLYMSPEQARGVDIDRRSDLYGLGVLGYAMLCGKTPFEDEPSPVEVLHAHIFKQPRPPHELRDDIPEALESLVVALLAKPADARPHLAEVKRRLAAFERRSAPILAATESAPVLRDAPRRPRAPWIGAAALAVLAVGAALYATSGGATHEVAAALPRPAAIAPAPAPPAAPPPPAVLTAAIQPADATVMLDDDLLANDHGRVRIEVAPGHHALTVRARGYRAVTRELDAVVGTPLEVTVRLAR